MDPQNHLHKSHIIQGAAIEPRFPHGSIVQAFDTICENASAHIALHGSGTTYGELQTKTVRLAQRLQNLGVTTGSRVGLLFSTSEEQIISLLAVLRAGGTYVPLDLYSPSTYAVSLARYANCKVIIAGHEVAEAEGIALLIFDADGPIQEVQSAAPAIFRSPAAETACILFTSGTTGKPKGVPLSGDAILTRISWWNRLYPMQVGDIFLSQLSAHTLGGTMVPLTALLQGCSVLTLDRDALMAVQTRPLEKRNLPITDVFIMPSLVEQFIQQKLALPKLKRMALTGEHCSDILLQTIFRHYPDAQILTLYGLTECAGHALAHRYTREESSTVLGKPSDNLSAWLLNEDLTPVDAGEPGLLYLSGRSLTERYLDPKMSAPVVTEPQSGTTLLGTNDVVRLGEDGNLHYVGRRDRQVKVRGFRVDLNHVENLLTQLPEIRRAAVLFENEQLVAFLIAEEVMPDEVMPDESRRTEGVATEKRLRQSIVEALPQWAIPQRLELMDELPLTDTQKVHYKALSARLSGTGLSGTELSDTGLSDAPMDLFESEHKADEEPIEEPLANPGEPESTAIVSQIIAAYNQVLQYDSTAIDDDFFHMGGDSFAVVQLVETLRSTGITPQQVYRHRTPLKLAEELESQLEHHPSFSEGQPFEETMLGLFAEALMGFAYVEKVPKWILAAAIPWLQRRFYLTILERAIIFEKAPDPAQLQSNLQIIGQQYPILRATAVIENGYWAERLEVSVKEITLMHCSPAEWEALRRSLRYQLSKMTETLIYFVLVDRVLHIISHHSVCDFYTLNRLTWLLGTNKLLTARDCIEKAPINQLETWRKSQLGLTTVDSSAAEYEALILPARAGSWALPPISRRTTEKINIRQINASKDSATGGAEVRLRTYAAWLATIYKLYGHREMTIHETMDLRAMPWLPYQYAETVGLMASICRMTLRYNPANNYRQTLDALQEQLTAQVQMENIWQSANWQMAKSLDRSWIFNFLPYPTNLDIQYQDRAHPPLSPFIQQQRSIEYIVHMQQESLWIELVYDQLRYSRQTVAGFLDHFRLEYGLITG